MIARKFLIVCALAVFALAAACGKSKDEPKSKTPPPATQPATPPAAELTDEELPVAADFEETAEAEITADNYKAELEALEQEIAAEDEAEQ